MAQTHWLLRRLHVGVAAKDNAKSDNAVNDLVGYAQDFGAFLSRPRLYCVVFADTTTIAPAGYPEPYFTCACDALKYRIS